MNLFSDRARWATILQTVDGAWRWRISGGRGVVREIVRQEPPNSGRIGIDIRVTGGALGREASR